jgi:hypothetical protein
MGNSFIYVLFWVLYYTLPSGGFIANPGNLSGFISVSSLITLVQSSQFCCLWWENTLAQSDVFVLV